MTESSHNTFAVCILLLYQDVAVVPRSSLPVFDPEYVSKAGTESTNLQTPAGNSTPRCLPAAAWEHRKILIKYDHDA